jgi:hypothetical protein
MHSLRANIPLPNVRRLQPEREHPEQAYTQNDVLGEAVGSHLTPTYFGLSRPKSHLDVCHRHRTYGVRVMVNRTKES